MINNRRLTKELKLNINNNNFKCILGTSNRLNPSVLYIKINAWCLYDSDIKNFKEDMIKLNSMVKNKFKEKLISSGLFKIDFIYTPEIKKTINTNKDTFYSKFEFTVKQREPITSDLKLIKFEIEKLIDIFLKDVEKNNFITFQKTKKPSIA